MSSLSIVIVCLAAVIGIYFYNNPLKHGPWFLSRRFLNWLPLGLTYAFLYMGRYNLTQLLVLKLISGKDFGDIDAVGSMVYGVAFLVNGPLTDRLGGRFAMLLGASVA